MDFHPSTKGEIEHVVRGLGMMPRIADEDTLHWLTTNGQPSALPPPAKTAAAEPATLPQ